MSLVAVIPARSGSKRIPDKNITKIGNHPLLAYSIAQAKQSEVVDRIYVATDSPEYQEIALAYGAEVPSLRSSDISGDKSADIEWVNWTIQEWQLNTTNEYLAILRPTAPLRRGIDIRTAWEKLRSDRKADSIRAVTKTSIHPGKMWTASGDYLKPLLPFHQDGVPWHSSQTASLPVVYFQNASLEIARISSIINTGSIAGETVIPFFSDGYSGWDINDPLDIEFLQFLVQTGQVELAL